MKRRKKNTARRKAAHKHKIAKALRRVGEGLKKKKNRRLGYS
jgi:hypothetical protein